ncbi:hypothetical protein WA026_014975 [Henosepilachna vigintioctopunctata]|uniref:Uncharacterized protein n=1 Tax=Henosepilachna vigintioctopunctata TaxID=420089 RepID=A0AAW1U914_9CUCU
MRFLFLIFLLTVFISEQEGRTKKKNKGQIEVEILMLCADRVRYDPEVSPTLEMLYDCFFKERAKYEPGDFTSITDPFTHMIVMLN